jgi:protein-S-isoprenylcysteine O-methyltransferase Ste14
MVELKKRILNLRYYFLNLILIWLAVLFYRSIPYYLNFLRQETQTTIFYLALSYTILGFFYYLYIQPEKTSESKGTIIFSAAKRLSKDSYGYIKRFNKLSKRQFPKIEKHEAVALLFILVKIFFLPIMLNFFFANLYSVKSQLINLHYFSQLFTINNFNSILFPFLLASIFLIDTLWFSFGYTFESRFLKNKIISVEPTIFGWVVALICYPPFNGMLTKYTNWYSNDYLMLSNQNLTFLIRISIIILLGIYVWATLALGTKCSNLTNRGIVSRGPYKIIRHPAYISKNLAWWLTVIPLATLPAIASMAAWSFIYHLRSITEERHLSKDANYLVYKSKVRYRYIPGVY